MTHFNSRGEIGQKLFLFLAEREVLYVVLGDTSQFPEIETDLDLCTESYCDFLSALKDFCISNDVSFINVRRHATGIRFDLAATTNDGDYVLFPGPDVLLFPTWKIKGDIGLSFQELLKSRRFNSFEIPIPSPKDAFVFYFIKKVDKGDLTIREGQYLSRIWRQDPDIIRKILHEKLPQKFGNLVAHAAETGSWDKVKVAMPDLRSELQRRSTWNFQRIIWLSKRLQSRVFFPPGLHVAFLGPDGSGKTSVINRVFSSLALAFSETSYVHLRPGIGRKKSRGGPVIDPHGQAPWSWPASVVKAAYLWLDYFVGWWLFVWPKKVRSTLIIFDRYYHDMLVDPKRYRYGGPMWLARWVGQLIPQPDLWILLDAPVEVLHGRKKEVPLKETARQRDAYLNLFDGMKNGIVIDASQHLDDVVADVNGAILNFMADRTAKRLGL